MTEQEQIVAEETFKVQLGNDLKKLRKSPEFKRLIGEVFLENGKNLIWENIKLRSEMLLQGLYAGNEAAMAEASIKNMNTQLQARLILESFLKMIESDAEGAEAELKELNTKE